MHVPSTKGLGTSPALMHIFGERNTNLWRHLNLAKDGELLISCLVGRDEVEERIVFIAQQGEDWKKPKTTVLFFTWLWIEGRGP